LELLIAGLHHAQLLWLLVSGTILQLVLKLLVQNHVICMAFIYCGNCGVSLNAAAPAAYAHRVALRFRKLLDTETGSDTNSVKRSFSGSSIAGGKPIHTIPVLKLKSHQSMFFC